MSVAVPGPGEARLLLARLGVPEEAIEEVVAARPLPDGPQHRQLAELHHELVATAKPTWWPNPKADAEPVERWLHLWVFLAAVPDAFALNASRGIPEVVTWDTLQDVGVNVRRHISAHGRPGFDGAWWLGQHVRGEIYTLGRLSFNRWAVVFDPGPDAGFAQGDPCLGVHIPPTGPLTPAACDAAFEQAADFFPRHVPDLPFVAATCASWLLDPHLADGLPADSNIVRFQRRFVTTDWEQPGDEDVLRFVFGNPTARVDELPTRTRLEQFLVDELRNGGHFVVRAGWLHL